jgi:ComF family protein
LCAGCEADLERIGHACLRCAMPLANTDQSLCGRCISSLPPWQAAFAPLHYRDALPWLIKAKYANQPQIYPILGDMLAQHIQAGGTSTAEVIVPVPLHRKRLHARGFNQSALLGYAIATRIGIPMHLHICQRMRHTNAQSGLSAQERQHNVRDAFVVSRPEPIRDKTVLIVDDVYTTGATLMAVAHTLLRAGARSLEVATVARASGD